MPSPPFAGEFSLPTLEAVHIKIINPSSCTVSSDGARRLKRSRWLLSRAAPNRSELIFVEQASFEDRPGQLPAPRTSTPQQAPARGLVL